MRTAFLAAAVAAGLASPAAWSVEIAPEDRSGIVDAITAIAAGADRRDWARVRMAMADTVTTDYTSLWGGEPVTQPADTLVSQWSGFLPGFEATQHLVSNHTITGLDGGTAAAQADFQATHRIGSALWVLGGRYDYRLIRSDDRWVVAAITMTADWESGDRGLVGMAAARAAEAANIGTVEAFYAHLEVKDMGAFLAQFAEDAVQDMPYAPPGFPKRVEGLAEIAGLYEGFPDATESVSFSVLSVDPAGDPNRLIAEVDGVIAFKGVEQPYRQRYIAVFEFEDGQIKLFREYFNPLPFAEATGLGTFVPTAE